jgi:hypothetical protein
MRTVPVGEQRATGTLANPCARRSEAACPFYCDAARSRRIVNLSSGGLILTGILLVTAVVAVGRLPPLHPAQLWTVPWTIAVGLYSLRLLPYRSLSTTTVVVAAASSLAFVAGALAGEHWLAPRTRRPSKPFQYGTVRTAAIGAALLTGVGVSVFVASAAASYGLHDTITASYRLRLAIDGGALTVQIKYVWAALASVALCSMAAGLAPTRRSTQVWLLLAGCSVASIYFATGRATIVSAIVIALVAYLATRRTPVGRRRFAVGVVAVAAVSLGIFIAGGQLIGKTFANDTDLRSVPSFFTRHQSFSGLALAYQYVSAPIAGLDVQVASSARVGGAGGCAVFTEVCRVLQKVGVPVTPVSRIRPFTAPPIVWNTYSGLDAPLIDWGRDLAVPMVGLLGIVCGLLWGWCRRRAGVGQILYSVEAAAIVGSWTTFTFTAPHIIGGLLIALVAIWVVHRVQGISVPQVPRSGRRTADPIVD